MDTCSPHAFFWYRMSRAGIGLSKHGNLSDRRFPDFQRRKKGGKGSNSNSNKSSSSPHGSSGSKCSETNKR